MKHSLIYTILILSLTFSCQDDDTITEPEATADTSVPLITLIGPASVDLIKGDTYTDLGATAVDIIDGDLSSSIVGHRRYARDDCGLFINYLAPR
jgi:hypothetical protein